MNPSAALLLFCVLANQDILSIVRVQEQQMLDHRFLGAQDIAVSSDGSVFISDKLDYRLLKIDGAGRVIAETGKRGAGPGEFRAPGPVAASTEAVAVADFASHRIQVFSSDLVYRNSFSVPGSVLDLQFDSQGYLWVALFQNASRDNLLKLTPEGNLEGSIALRSATSDLFDNMFRFDVDPHGTIAVVYRFRNKVEMWRTDGSFVQSLEISGFPSRSSKKRVGNELIVPEDDLFSAVTLDNEGTIIVLAGEYTFSPRREVFGVSKSGVPTFLAVLPRKSSLIEKGPDNRLYSIENDRTTVTVYRLK